MPSIVATPQADRGRVALEVVGGDPSTGLYIFRRSGRGVDIVRDTSEGTAGFPALDPVATNLVQNPRPAGSAALWVTDGATSAATLVDDALVLSILPSAAVSATLRPVGPDAVGPSGAWPVTPGQTVRLYAELVAPRSGTVVTRIIGMTAAGVQTEVIATNTWAAAANGTRTVDISGVAGAATAYVRAEVTATVPGPANASAATSFEDTSSVGLMRSTTNVNVGLSTTWASDGVQSLISSVQASQPVTAVYQDAPLVAPEPGKWYGVGVDVRGSAGVVWVRPAISFRDSSGALIGSVSYGAYTQATTGATARVTHSAQVPANAARVETYLYVYGSNAGAAILGGAAWLSDAWMVVANAASSADALAGAGTYRAPSQGPVLRTNRWMLRRGTPAEVAGGYFDGSTASSDPAYGYDWLGPDDASASVYGRFVPATIYDYEPVQGSTVDYILADDDGNMLATARVVIPRWGTWLKSPGRPSRNVRVYYGRTESTILPIERERYAIEGSGSVVVYAARRSVEEASRLELITRTDEAAAAMRSILADGATLLLDVPPSWGVPFRYISVGEVEVGRPLAASDGYGNLEAAARLWGLAEVIAQPSPQGVSQEDPGRTYAVLPTEFATYVAIPATVESYEALATRGVS